MGNLPDIFCYVCQNFSIDIYLDTTVSLVEFPTSFSFLHYSILIDGSPHLGLLLGQQFQCSCDFISYNLKYHLQLIYLVEHGNGSPVSSNPVLCLWPDHNTGLSVGGGDSSLPQFCFPPSLMNHFSLWLNCHKLGTPRGCHKSGFVEERCFQYGLMPGIARKGLVSGWFPVHFCSRIPEVELKGVQVWFPFPPFWGAQYQVSYRYHYRPGLFCISFLPPRYNLYLLGLSILCLLFLWTRSNSEYTPCPHASCSIPLE